MSQSSRRRTGKSIVELGELVPFGSQPQVVAEPNAAAAAPQQIASDTNVVKGRTNRLTSTPGSGSGRTSGSFVAPSPRRPRKSSEFMGLDSNDRLQSGGQRGSNRSDEAGAIHDDFDPHVYLRSKQEQRSSGMTRGSFQKMKKAEAQKGELEVWWLNSPTWQRTVPLMCVTLLIISILHAISAVYFFSIGDKVVDDVDVCKTQGCIDISNWIKVGLDKSYDPCEDFYRYTCNNYKDPVGSVGGKQSIPKRLNFEFARIEFNADGVLAKSLKPQNDPENIIVPYYKACLDTRRSDNKDIEATAKIINKLLPFLFTDTKNYPKEDAASNITSFVGHNGFLRFQLLEFPNIALLPPPDWVYSFQETVENETLAVDFIEELSKTYTILWNALENVSGKQVLDLSPHKAADLTAKVLKSITSIQFTHTKGNTSKEEFQKRSRQFIGNMLGDYVVKVLDIQERIFTDNDLNDLTSAYQTIAIEERGPALLSYWIFCALECLQEDMSKKAAAKLNLNNVFTNTTFIHRERTIEQYCFESLVKHVTGYTVQQFVKKIPNVKRLSKKMNENFLSIQRVMREIYVTEWIFEYLSPFDALILRRFMGPRNKITLNYPFPCRPSQRQFFEDLTARQNGLKPGVDFLINVMEANVMGRAGHIKSWREGRTDPRKSRHDFRLERQQCEIDDTINYVNSIFPPIAMFDRPLFQNDMRVFDHAGSIIFLARSFLELWLKNVENHGPLIPILTFDQIDTLERAKSFVNPLESHCRFQGKRESHSNYFQHPATTDAFAFKIALQLLREPKKYASLAYKKNGTRAKGVEPFFNSNGTMDYVRVVTNPKTKLLDYEYLNNDDYVPYETAKDKYKFHLTRAPGLEQYTEEQLFFLAAIRHHCFESNSYNTEREEKYATSVNLVLQQLIEFADVWKCPIASPMNPPNKCC